MAKENDDSYCRLHKIVECWLLKTDNMSKEMMIHIVDSINTEKTFASIFLDMIK